MTIYRPVDPPCAAFISDTRRLHIASTSPPYPLRIGSIAARRRLCIYRRGRKRPGRKRTPTLLHHILPALILLRGRRRISSSDPKKKARHQPDGGHRSMLGCLCFFRRSLVERGEVGDGARNRVLVGRDDVACHTTASSQFGPRWAPVVADAQRRQSSLIHRCSAAAVIVNPPMLGGSSHR